MYIYIYICVCVCVCKGHDYSILNVVINFKKP